MRFPYKTYPDPKGGVDYCPLLAVQIANPGKHSPPSRRFEVIIDSGAERCIFHSQIGRAIGINIEKGEKEETIGVSGKQTMLYVHPVLLYVCGEIVTIRAGFSPDLPLAGLLGRKGFFENFKIVFDPSGTPPQFEVARIHKA